MHLDLNDISGGAFYMKKMYIITVLTFVLLLNVRAVHASEYETYQSMEFAVDGPVLLEHYTQKMYDAYYKKIDRRQFWGWKTYTKYETEQVYYIKDTLYVIVNEGTTAIDEKFIFKTVETDKRQYSVSGNINLKASGEAYTIELGFENELDWSIDRTLTQSYTENIEIRVEVDPNTKLTVEMRGEGKISNGVAKYFRFWRSVRKGGWEAFVVTTEYYSLRKEVIDETK